MLEALKNKLQSKNSANNDGVSLLDSMFVPEAVQQSRYQTCLSCTHFQTLLKTCSICHCIMPLKTKLASQRCPIKKWDKYTA